MRGSGRVFVVGLLLAFGANDAFAKKSDNEKKKDVGIELTGIESFDSVFARVGEIDALLANAEKELRVGKQNLNTALALKKGTPITDGLNELAGLAEGKLSVAVTDLAVPKLTVTDAVPSNVQSAVDAVNGLSTNLTTSLADLQNIVPEIEGLISETQKMPLRLKDEFKADSGLVEQLLALPKATKALTHNLEVTTGLSDRSLSVTNRITDITGVLTNEFKGVGGPAGSPSGTPSRTGATTGVKQKPVKK